MRMKMTTMKSSTIEGELLVQCKCNQDVMNYIIVLQNRTDKYTLIIGYSCRASAMHDRKQTPFQSISIVPSLII